MKPLIEYLEWMMGKWHQNGLHTFTREDFVKLERLYLEARAHDSDVEHAVMEFTEAMNSPRGDAADRRRGAALKQLRAKHADIIKQRQATINGGTRITPG